jgi:hypothetical protein
MPPRRPRGARLARVLALAAALCAVPAPARAQVPARAAAPRPAASRPAAIPEIAYTRTVLSNGLTLLVTRTTRRRSSP